MKLVFQRTFSYLFLVLMLASVSCKTPIRPSPPDAAAIQREYKKELSSLNIPVVIDIAELERTVNAELKGKLYEDLDYENNDGDNLKMVVKKLRDIQLSASGSTIYYSIPLYIWADYQKWGMSRATDMELILKFKTAIDVNRKWELDTKSELVQYKWLKPPTISLMGMSIPITPIVEGVLDDELPALAKMLDAEVKDNFDSRKYMREAWMEIQKPMLVNEDYNAWLKIEPKYFVLGPIKGNNRQIILNLGMKGFLEINMGQKPTYTMETELPDLVKSDKEQDDFHMTVASEITFEQATAIVRENLIGYTYNYGKKVIRVTDVKVFGIGDELGLQLNIDGSVEGAIYLKGMPTYDPETTEISLENFDYDVKTKKAILSAADWMLHGAFKKRIASYMKFPLKETIEEYSAIAEESLKENPVSDNVHLSCHIDRVLPQEIYITPTAIRTYLFIDGQAKVLFGK